MIDYAERICDSCNWTPESQVRRPTCVEDDFKVCRAPRQAMLDRLHAQGHIAEPTDRAYADSLLIRMSAIIL